MKDNKKSLAKMLKTIGASEVEANIRSNHHVEATLSVTRRKELENQLSSPKAGVRAHLESCQRCRGDIERKFEKTATSASDRDSAFIPAPAIA